MSFRLATLGALLILCGCGDRTEQKSPPAVPVETVTITPREVPNVVELPGRVEPVREAEVRARVNGIVEKRLYEEGTFVSAGQPLFRIDPREKQAALSQAEASLNRAEATLANASAVVERYRPLVAENAVSRQEFDAAVAAEREAKANVSQMRASLEAAQLQLSYTTVRSPIAGRASSAEVTEGALVSQAEGTLMTRVQQISPIYVRFAQSVTQLQDIRDAIAAGQIDLGENDLVEVRLTFPNGSEYPIPGYVDFLDYSVDRQTGTVAVRAEFPNPDRQLLPGEFVRATFYVGKRKNGITVPQRAVKMTERGGTVFVVGRDDKVQLRPVTLGNMIDGRWIVTDGLSPGDVVVTSNLQKMRPGVAVARAEGGKPGGEAGARTQQAATSSAPGR
ncbi:MAG: efflux RND transporter periplasmic adaptor subunit [Porphyrobacter sp.]|nr:efflux RND transporter periplasmic adaptor subunit [Porphyrobacter sp.]